MPNYFLGVKVLAVDCVIELLHVLIADLVRKFSQRGAYLGMLLQRLRPNHRDCFIGWKVMAIVIEDKKGQAQESGRPWCCRRSGPPGFL